MDLPKSGDATSRFLAFVEGLTSVIGHADRAKPLRDYCIGLMMPGERKSVEPMAAITAPERTAAQHQSLLHFVGEPGTKKIFAGIKNGRQMPAAYRRYGRFRKDAPRTGFCCARMVAVTSRHRCTRIGRFTVIWPRRLGVVA